MAYVVPFIVTETDDEILFSTLTKNIISFFIYQYSFPTNIIGKIFNGWSSSS